MTRSSVKITLIFFSFKKHSHTTPHLKKKKLSFNIIHYHKKFKLYKSNEKNFISTFHKIQYFKTIQDTSVGVINHQSQWTCTIISPQTYEPTKYNTGHGCVLCHHLQPSSWCSTQIDYNSCSLKKLKLSIQLNQLECRSCPITWREKKYQPT